jgi:hypothetical protein
MQPAEKKSEANTLAAFQDSQETQKMIRQVAEKQQEMANGINAIQDLLAEHVRAQDIAIERNRSESSPHFALSFRGTHSNF